MFTVNNSKLNWLNYLNQTSPPFPEIISAAVLAAAGEVLRLGGTSAAVHMKESQYLGLLMKIVDDANTDRLYCKHRAYCKRKFDHKRMCSRFSKEEALVRTSRKEAQYAKTNLGCVYFPQPWKLNRGIFIIFSQVNLLYWASQQARWVTELLS